MHSIISITENARFEPFMNIESVYTLLDLMDTPENFDDHLARYSFGVITRSGFGIKADSIQHPLIQEVDYQNDFVVNCFRPDKYLCNLAPFMLKAPSWICSDYEKLETFRKRLVKTVLDLRDQAKGDCLQQYFTDHQNEFGLSDLEGGMAFASFLGAGTRSPHNALLGFVIAMLRYPAWQTKLQEEIDQVVGPNRLPAFEDMPNLPTLRAVVLEGIRYRSVHAEIGIPHRLSQDDIYEGYFFPAGTIFHANIRSVWDKLDYQNSTD